MLNLRQKCLKQFVYALFTGLRSIDSLDNLDSRVDSGLPIRILIIDTHSMVRSALAASFEAMDGIECVGEADDGEAGLRLCAELVPDIVITELHLPKISGVALTRTLTQIYPQIKIIALDTLEREDEIAPIFEAGACKYLFKDSNIDELEQVIREVINPPLPNSDGHSQKAETG